MKKITILSLFLLFTGIMQVFPASLKVMTFNIRYDNPDDGIYSWDNRKPMVFTVLKQESPDIIGFQEVLKSQLDDIAGAFPGYEWSGVGRDDGKELGEYSVIFYKKERFEKTGGSTFWLSETPEIPGSRSWNAACNRIVTWVKLKDKKSGSVFFVFNTHFDHASEQARQESAKLFLDRIKAISGDAIAVITGDFNDTAGSIPYSILTRGPDRLLDSGVWAGAKSGPGYSFIGFPFKPEPGNLIDFIFTRNLEPALIRSHTVLSYNKHGKYPSDHLPVQAILEIPEISDK
jgi:endonuclease/exonuclease/phosphatase family metal-dependent hydrolase